MTQPQHPAPSAHRLAADDDPVVAARACDKAAADRRDAAIDDFHRQAQNPERIRNRSPIAEAADGPLDYQRRFDPVVVRTRHDGWTPAKQAEFIRALGEAGCVADACRAVGMSVKGAYTLRGRFDAVDFRRSWDAALDYAVDRLADNALSRAIDGVAVPHYYKGAVVGEHRRFDEGLTRFILRYRRPLTYGRHLDRMAVNGHVEDLAERFAVGLDRVRRDVSRDEMEREGIVRWASAAAKAATAAEAYLDRADSGDADGDDAEIDRRFEIAETLYAEAVAYADAVAAARREAAAVEAAETAADTAGEVPPDVALPSAPFATDAALDAALDAAAADAPALDFEAAARIAAAAEPLDPRWEFVLAAAKDDAAWRALMGSDDGNDDDRAIEIKSARPGPAPPAVRGNRLSRRAARAATRRTARAARR